MSGQPYEVIAWRDGALVLLDQTLLPHRLEYVRIDSLEAGCEAIRTMRVRGAPAIGIAAAYTLAVALTPRPPLPRSGGEGEAGRGGVRGTLQQAAAALVATRPTAVNLRWAVEQVLAAIEDCPTDEAVRAAVITEAQRIHQDQVEADRAMAESGAALVPPGSTVITHCNTGPLATGGLGTALGVVIEAHRQGRVVEVLADETRPRLQGARLTSWELLQHEVPHHVIADGAAAALMSRRPIAAAFVGADRIAANGDTANKIGTYGLAIACRHHGVPFYVVAPVSTIDPRAADGSAIPVEERDESEVLSAGLERLAPDGASALNPAFDVTPADLITAIVTERGVLHPPFSAAIREMLDRAR